MEKLEFKHIAPYWPFGLRVTYVQKLFGGEKIEYHHRQSIDRIFLDYGFINLHTEPYSCQAPLGSYLPELRPLSDLTKETEINGEKFVPGLMLVDPECKDHAIMVCEFYNPFPHIPNHKKWVRVVHQDLGEVISININNIEHLRHDVFKKLVEWHFDVFGLIAKGLAIDINTLKTNEENGINK